MVSVSFLYPIKGVMLPVPDIHDLPTIRLNRLITFNYTFVFAREHTAATSRRKMTRLRFPTFRLARELSPPREMTRFRRRLIVGLWILVLAVSMIGWLVALAWIAYQLVRRLVS